MNEAKKVKATKKSKNKELDTWTATCPECGKKHKKDLPADNPDHPEWGSYDGFIFECCEMPGNETVDVLESVQLTKEERKQGKKDWKVSGKKKKRHVFKAEL